MTTPMGLHQREAGKREMLLTLAAPDASTREKSKEGVRTGALFFLISGKGGRHRVGQGHHGVRRRGEQHGDGRRLEALELLVTRPGIAHLALAHLHVMRELVRVLVYELHGRHRGGELHFHFGHSVHGACESVATNVIGATGTPTTVWKPSGRTECSLSLFLTPYERTSCLGSNTGENWREKRGNDSPRLLWNDANRRDFGCSVKQTRITACSVCTDTASYRRSRFPRPPSRRGWRQTWDCRVASLLQRTTSCSLSYSARQLSCGSRSGR